MRINLFGDRFETREDEPEEEIEAQKLDIPIHAFDVIIADECHRGYTAMEESKWREVLDYFDAITIGLTATPAAHTVAYFGEPVYRYGYEEAVIMVQRVVNFIPTKTLWEQYIDFLMNVFQGNLGRSMTVATGISVGRIIAGALPWTVFLLSISVVLSFAIGVLLGMYMAYNRNSLLDRFLSLFASITSAIPQFVLGLVLVLFLACLLYTSPSPRD